MPGRHLADTLLDLSHRNGKTIAEQWYKAVSTNPRTPSFQKLPEDDLVSRAEYIFKNLKQLYFADDPFQEIQQFLKDWDYIKFTLSFNVPLHENIYAIILMRRHIWLYADNQALFNTTVDMYQALESINRTILLFDYATYIMARKYDETRHI